MRLATINLDWLEREIINNEGETAYQEALMSVRSRCTPVEECSFSSEYHPERLLEKLATSNDNYINLLCSDMVKNWNNTYGSSTMIRFKHRAFGKGYKLTVITGGLVMKI